MRKLFSSTPRVVVALFLSLFMTNFAPVMTAYATKPVDDVVTTTTTPISAKALTDHECNAEEWHFVITDVEPEANAPASITVNFANGNSVVVALQKFTGKTAHYTTYGNLTSTVTSATAVIYSGWSGQFNLSHGPCGTPTNIEVTPATPSHVDPCGTADDKYTITATTGVIYKVNGQVTAAGTYNGTGTIEITAEAAAGYTITGTKAWTFDFTNAVCPIIVTPASPSSTDVCGTVNDKYTIPSTTGVIYKVNGTVVLAGNHSGTGTVVVTAEADAGYILTPGTYSWTFDFTNVTCDVDVTPAAPTHNDVCETANDTYTIPTTTGVDYKVNGQVVTTGTYSGTGIVTVTAETTGAPYVLNGITSWTFNFTNISCGHVLGDTTTPTPTGHILSTSTNIPSVLPATGATPVPTGLLPLVGAVATYLIAYNRSSRKNAKA